MPPTIRAVAEAAGVSTTTVSFVLNNRRPQVDAIPEGTRERVRSCAAALGYRRNAAAASLRTGRSHWIGVVVQPLRDERDAHMWAPYELALLSGAQNTLTKNGYFAVLGAKSPTGSTEYLDELVPSGIGGIIYRRPLRRIVQRLDELAADGIPSIAVFPRNKSDRYPYTVDTDNLRAGQLSAELLLRAGARAPMYVINELDYALHPELDRAEGFSEVIERELGFSPAKCEVTWADGDEDKTRAIVEAIQKYHPDAIMPGEPGCSHLTMVAIDRLGLQSPRDISVIGYDCYFFPSPRGQRISAVATSWFRAGQVAAEGILDMVRNKVEWTEPVLLEPQFLAGDTTPPEIADEGDFYWLF